MSELAGRTSQLANEIGFFERVFAEKPSPSCILFKIRLIWIVSIKSEIFIVTGMVLPVCSDKSKEAKDIFNRPKLYM